MIALKLPRHIAPCIIAALLAVLCAGTLLLSSCGDNSPTSPDNGNGGPTYAWTALFPKPQPNDITDAARSASGTLLAAGRAGTILRSTDDGVTWQVRRAESALEDLRAVDIAGDFAVAVGNYGAAVRSTDGGRTWEEMDFAGPEVFFSDVDVVDGSTAYAVGIPGKVWSTTDAGVTWTETDLGMIEPQAVSVIDRDEGMIASYEGWYWTHNGGGIWFERDRPPSIYPREVHMTGPLSAVAVSQSVSPTELVIYTTDDTGLTWTRRHTQSAYEYYDLSVVADTVCYAHLHGHVLRSLDAGLTWTELCEIERFNEVVLATGESSFAVFGPGGYWATSDDSGVTLTSRTRTVGDLETPGTIGALQFLDESTGFAGFHENGLMHTDDGGGTWTPLVENHHVIDFHFAGADTAVALMREDTGSSGPYDLCRSTDGGQSWTPLHTDDFYASHLLPGGTGLATGASGTILCTEDGGTTWGAITSPDDGYLRDPFCVSADTLIVLDLFYDIYRSYDGGASWQTWILGNHMEGIDFNADRSVGICVGLLGQYGGAAARTTDRGVTWDHISMDTGPLRDVRFVDASTAYAVGDGGTIIKTTDAGLTWTREECVNGQRLECLSALPDGRAWAGGQYGTIVRLE